MVDAPSSPQAIDARLRSSRRPHLLEGGPEGNEILTTVNGAMLIALLAVIGLTIVALGRLLSVHLFVGIVLIGPLALKLASTGYRFTRYYGGDPTYRRKGPPPTVLRAIAPIVVLSTLAVMVSGVALLLLGPSSRDTLLPIHKVSFIVWVSFTSIHVLAHLPAVAGMFYGRPAGFARRRVRGATARTVSLTSSLLAGVGLAVLLIPTYAPWLHAHLQHH
jgi:hypothetical protein